MNDKDDLKENTSVEKAELTSEELQEKIERTFSHLEFNNEEEDKKVVRESKWREYVSKRRTLFILGCVIFGVILAFLLFETSFSKNHKYNEEGEKQFETAGSYGTNHGILYSNQYIYDSENKVLMDLSLKEIGKLGGKENSISYQDSSYFIFMNQGNFDVKRVDENKIVSYFTNKKSFPIMENDTQIVGAYESSGEKYYIFAGDTYLEESFKDIKVDTIDSDQKGTYIYTNRVDHSLTRYDEKYFITVNKSDGRKYGLYDSDSEQQVIRPIYEEMCYLDSNRYAVMKNGMVGIVDSSSKVIEDFQLVVSDSKNKSFFAKQIFGKTLVMIGSNSMSSDYVYHGPYSSYYLQDSQFVPWNQNLWYDVDVFGQYLIVTNNSEKNAFSIYDRNLNLVSSFTAPVSNSTILGIFLYNVLVIRGDNGYSFFDIGSGANLGTLNTFNKEYGEYMLTFQLGSNGLGTVIISSEERELGRLENASFDHFILNGDDRLLITDDKIIYHASSSSSLDGDLLMIKK
ncbi:MAG: hypothetical protein IJI60_01810 [Bacilli bacterium]|nr:hypothetical protein [Bacilli bacterium]